MNKLGLYSLSPCLKVRVIKSKRRQPRFFINIPLPLAASLELEVGEQIQWQSLNRADLRLLRSAPPPKRQK